MVYSHSLPTEVLHLKKYIKRGLRPWDFFQTGQQCLYVYHSTSVNFTYTVFAHNITGIVIKTVRRRHRKLDV